MYPLFVIKLIVHENVYKIYSPYKINLINIIHEKLELRFY